MKCEKCNKDMILMEEDSGYRKLWICPKCRKNIILVENKYSGWGEDDN